MKLNVFTVCCGIFRSPLQVAVEQPLDGNRDAPEEATDGGSTLRELVLHLQLDDVSWQGDEVKHLSRHEAVMQCAGKDGDKLLELLIERKLTSLALTETCVFCIQ